MKFAFSLLFVAIILLNGEGINGAPVADARKFDKFTFDDSVLSLEICLELGSTGTALNADTVTGVQLVVGDPSSVKKEIDIKLDVSTLTEKCATFDSVDTELLPTTTTTFTGAISYELIIVETVASVVTEKSIGPIEIAKDLVGKEYATIKCGKLSDGSDIEHRRYTMACDGVAAGTLNGETVDGNCYISADADYFLVDSVEVYGLSKESTVSVEDLSPLTVGMKKGASITDPEIILSSTDEYIMIDFNGDTTYGAYPTDGSNIALTSYTYDAANEMTICAVVETTDSTGTTVTTGSVGPFKDIALDAGVSGDYVNVGFLNSNTDTEKYSVGAGSTEITVDCSLLEATDTCYSFLKTTETTIYAQYQDINGVKTGAEFYYVLPAPAP